MGGIVVLEWRVRVRAFIVSFLVLVFSAAAVQAQFMHHEVRVMNPLPFADRNRVVVLTATQIGLAVGQPLPGVSVVEKRTGRAVPAQLDDLDGDGKVSASDEIAFLVNLPAGCSAVYEIQFGASAKPAASAMRSSITESGVTVDADSFTVGSDNKGQWTFSPKGSASAFFDCKPIAEENKTRFIAGPARVLILSESPISKNGLLKRRVQVTPSAVKMTNSISSQDGKSSALVENCGGFFFGLPQLERVTNLRVRSAEGYLATAKKPVDDLFALPTTPIALDLVMQPLSVLVSLRQQPDYVPSVGLIGWHKYMSCGLAFGWRPPIEIKVGKPHVQEVWIMAHAGAMDEFKQLDRQVRTSPVMAAGPARRPATTMMVTRPARRPATTMMVTRPARRPATTMCLQDIAGLRAEIERVAKTTSGGKGEMTPAKVLLGKAKVCCVAAEWDFNLDHWARASERVKMAAAFLAQTKHYIAHPSARLLGRASPAWIKPYVTFSEGTGGKMAALGLTVGHTWVPWGAWFEQFETEPSEGVWRYDQMDGVFQTANSSQMKLIALADYNPPRWYKAKFDGPQPVPGQPPGSVGGDGFVSPEMLGRVPPFMQPFGEYIKQIAKRYGSNPALLGWSVHNEPAYYSQGGIKGDLMTEAWRNWLAKRYPDVKKLNRNWGTSFASLPDVKAPDKWEENRAAWWDVMTFKAECLAGELKWETDLLRQNGACQRTGAKYVAVCLSPNGARVGWAVDPWISSPPQRGMSLTDLYADDLWETALRVTELYYSGGENPVISPEIGRTTRPVERPYHFNFYPDSSARSRAWALFQHGLIGSHYWVWASTEEYSVQDWDGALTDFGLQAALANQDFQPGGDHLAKLKPVVVAGYYYPRATFVQSEGGETTQYQRLYTFLTQAGYQLRPVSAVDFDKVAPGLKALVVPPAPFIENEMRSKLAAFAKRGGKLILLGPNSGAFDEFTHPQAPLAKSIQGGNVICTSAAFKADWVEGAPLTDLGGDWKFRFGAKWPQAPDNARTSEAGHVDEGMGGRWFDPGLDDSGWASIKVPGVWEERGFPDLDGYGWYRKHFTLPDIKKAVLSGSTLDDRAWIYVNGTLVRKTTVWDEVWKVDVTKYLKPGKENVIALRILDNCFLGGVRGNIALTDPGQLSSNGRAVCEAMSKAGIKPSTQSREDGVFRTLMKDERGRLHLVLANSLNVPQRVSVAVPAAPGEMTDMLSGERWRCANGVITGVLPPCGAAWVPLWR